MRDQGKKPFGKKNRDTNNGSGSSKRPFEAFRKQELPARAEEKPLKRVDGYGKGKKKPVVAEGANTLPRLNQYVAKAGVCSRREADELIATGKIKVNGKIVREMGRRVQIDDKVEYEGRVLQGEELRYVLLNKPKGFICNVSDEKGRKTVMDLVKKACKERIYPVGRLERDTTGLLLFTNDGDLAKRLTMPAAKVKQIYHVYLNKPMEESDILTLMDGIKIEGESVKPDIVNYVQEVEDGTQLGAQFHSGRNTFVRAMFEHFGYEVPKLDRSLYANLTKKDLSRGKWRHLKEKEITMLKIVAGKDKKEEKVQEAAKMDRPKVAKPNISKPNAKPARPTKTLSKAPLTAKPKAAVRKKKD
ncbi:MAG: rRNA pseudouridine synthase [Flavobacteriales bacterium]|nr:rRNA pseudouridine synthase [Flavobacteriales bacterium]